MFNKLFLIIKTAVSYYLFVLLIVGRRGRELNCDFSFFNLIGIGFFTLFEFEEGGERLEVGFLFFGGSIHN